MRLRLKQTSGAVQTAVKNDWYLERGRRTVGRANECDWQIHDDSCSVSKHHCTLERTMNGFVLHDESANGTKVDNRLVASGESAPLADGSHIVMGRYSFDVIIAGTLPDAIDDPDRELSLSDENLTISSILANVTSTGIGGHGILGSNGQSSELPGRRSTAKRKQIPIGWEGPPQTDALKPVLPDDWNDETGLSTSMEHKDVIRSHAPRIRTQAQEDIAPEAVTEPVVQTLAPHVDLSALDAAIRKLETSLSDGEILLNTPQQPMPDSDPQQAAEAVLAQRLQQLVERQIVLNQRIDTLLDKAANLFDHALIEARADAQPRRFPWIAEMAYWQAYCEQFLIDGKRTSVRDLLLKALDATPEDTTQPTRSETTDETR